MRLVVAGLAEDHQLVRTLIPDVPVRQVMDVELFGGGTPSTTIASALKSCPSNALPMGTCKVLAVPLNAAARHLIRWDRSLDMDTSLPNGGQ